MDPSALKYILRLQQDQSTTVTALIKLIWFNNSDLYYWWELWPSHYDVTSLLLASNISDDYGH